MTSTITVEIGLRPWVKPAMTLLAWLCGIAAYVLPVRWVEAVAQRVIGVAVHLGTTTRLCPTPPIDTRTFADISRADQKNS